MKIQIELTQKVQKKLVKLPNNIVLALDAWVDKVKILGLEKTRKITGYHDEPLQGKRKGQRSIRLSKSYRALYEVYYKIELKENIRILLVVDVNKHRY